MTALCGGGSSAPKAGVAQTVIFTTGALASLLNNRGGLWATVAAPLLGVLAYNATELCGSDPPAQPTISAAEYQALLELGPWNDLQTALGKLADLAAITIWHEMCECVSPTATPAAPSGLWNLPSGITLPSFNGSCPQPRLRVTASRVYTTGNLPTLTNITELVFPGYPTQQSVASTGWEVQTIIAVPSNWLQITGALDWVSSTSTPSGLGRVSVYLYGTNKVAFTGVNLDVSAAATHGTWPSSPPGLLDVSAAAYLSVNALVPGGSAGRTEMDVAYNITCSGVGAQPAGCCPPDPAVLALLQQLLSAVQLQQRWRLPFGTVDGPSHAGSGSGTFAVDRVIGLRVEITAQPPGLRQSFGNPTYTFDLGWISVSDDGGMLQELRITRDSQQWFPQQMQLATVVGYALRSGVAATITELRSEPL